MIHFSFPNAETPDDMPRAKPERVDADEWLSDPKNWPDDSNVIREIEHNTHLLRVDRARELNRARALKHQPGYDRREFATRVKWAWESHRQIMNNLRGLKLLVGAMKHEVII